MWFRRTQKNRRLSRGHVLDVKLRSDQVRATRTRLAALTFGVAFGTVFGFYLLWRIGGWALDHFVYENPAFAIQNIEVQTDGVIATDQLRRWAGVKAGDNLLALDLARVKRDLELMPLIGSVSVERILPRTLRIRVTERNPVAQVNVPRLDGRGGVEVVVFQIDTEGCVMVPLDPQQRAVPLSQVDDQLPVLSGVNTRELQPGRRIESPQVQAAVRLIDEFDRSPMAGLVDLRRIDVSAPEVLVATTGQGSEVTFALQDLERQLRRWREIYDLGQRMSRVIATLDLAVPNNIPARWIEASAAPVVTVKPPKPQRNKPKHV
jgi:cell division septal protein FtsQ